MPPPPAFPLFRALTQQVYWGEWDLLGVGVCWGGVCWGRVESVEVRVGSVGGRGGVCWSEWGLLGWGLLRWGLLGWSGVCWSKGGVCWGQGWGLRSFISHRLPEDTERLLVCWGGIGWSSGFIGNVLNTT